MTEAQEIYGEFNPSLSPEIRRFVIRGIKVNLGLRSYFTPGSRARSADQKKSEFPRWR
jgi:hypothetical protein